MHFHLVLKGVELISVERIGIERETLDLQSFGFGFSETLREREREYRRILNSF